MKQWETTVLLGFLMVISFYLGHASLSLNEFWTEPIIRGWPAIVLPTGEASLNTGRGPLSPFKILVSFKDSTWFPKGNKLAEFNCSITEVLLGTF